MENKQGFVSFVGAGPGDIGLITKKGAESIGKADIILYDRLVNPRLLRYAKETCEFVYCGKLPQRHTLRQEKINALLVQYAEQGKYVVRLKGGDPAVFGRVGEEAEALTKHHLPYEIIPGITASIAAATYAGIPVTHRDYSNSLTLRTGHYCANNEGNSATGQQIGETIAYYMGVKNLPNNCRKLIEQGKSSDTKVALIQWATLGKQKVVEGTLATIATIIQNEKIENPAMMIVGDVVSLRDSLAWFEKKRFFGKRIIIAKSSVGDYQLENHFTSHGAEAYSFPTMKKTNARFTDDELMKIIQSERLIIQTPDSVGILLDQVMEAGYDIRDLPRNIQCRSDKTLKELASKGLIAKKVIDSDLQTVIVGAKGSEYQLPELESCSVYFSHEVSIDQRFNEINQRVLSEDKWETVIFPNKASVDTYMAELRGAQYKRISKTSICLCW